MPFTWGALTAEFGQGFDAVFTAKELFGEKVWNVLYAGTDPGPEAVVPRQVANLLRFALNKVKKQTGETDESKELVRKHWEALQESAKKLRAQ